MDKSLDSRSQGAEFETQLDTNVLWQDVIYICHFPARRKRVPDMLVSLTAHLKLG